jgi:hypothetical protein
MEKTPKLMCAVCGCLLLSIVTAGCSPRDFLTRRLAADLIAASIPFRTPQVFYLKIGVVSNQQVSSPEVLVLQHRGWINGTAIKCPPEIEPPPCWDLLPTPLGVDVLRPLLTGALPDYSRDSQPISIPVARRELLSISGISKTGNLADVEFTWRWVAINQVGAALYDSGVHYRSVVGFRGYDDGWRVMTQTLPTNQPLDDALRTAQPAAP